MIAQRIKCLRAAMKERGLDAYIIPTADYHGSEYVGEYFKVRQYFSGFTGSAGILVISMEEAGLWTDSRYFLQAEQELEGSGIHLYRMGEEDTPTVQEYLNQHLPEESTIGADGRMVDAAWGISLQKMLGDKRHLAFSEDLAALLWEERPSLPKASVYLLEERYAGESAANKLFRIRRKMMECGAELHLITALDQIAWLLNIRGSDVACNPVVLSYALIEMERAVLFLDQEKITPEVQEYLTELGVETRPYEDIFSALKEYSGKRILVDSQRTNYAIYSLLSDMLIIDRESPILHAKAVKNPIEQENLRKAHIKDGVAMVKLLHWLKTQQETVTECQAAEKIDHLRIEQAGCVGASFHTISAYGHHGAIVHYHATPQSDIPLEKKGFFLLDSGGQYYEGTTDVTRTVAMGEVTAEQKRHFTLVLQGMLNLSNAVFPAGCRGYHLDVLARSPLWRQGLDYGHGTGHGIGYMLCVHEAPIGFSWRRTARYDTEVLLPGMVISDEPGVYIRDSHGIRIENQLLCREAEQDGFLTFETLTLVPIDLDAVDLGWLDAAGREQLNSYHGRVYETLSPYLTEEEQGWLRYATRPV